MAIHKTLEVFRRFAFQDLVLPIDENLVPEDYQDTINDNAYLVGYEDEHGEECNKDGVYLNQRYVAQ